MESHVARQFLETVEVTIRFVAKTLTLHRKITIMNGIDIGIVEIAVVMMKWNFRHFAVISWEQAGQYAVE